MTNFASSENNRKSIHTIYIIGVKGILRKAAYTLFLLLAGTNFLFAQDTPVRINGSVRDVYGNPLPYTTVRIEDTANGCTTDNNGKFSFNAHIEGATLIVSSIGYEDFKLKMTSATRFPRDNDR